MSLNELIATVVRPDILKRALILAYKIFFFQLLIVWLFPLLPPMVAWSYVVFCRIAYLFIVEVD